MNRTLSELPHDFLKTSLAGLVSSRAETRRAARHRRAPDLQRAHSLAMAWWRDYSCQFLCRGCGEIIAWAISIPIGCIARTMSSQRQSLHILSAGASLDAKLGTRCTAPSPAEGLHQ